MHILIENLPDAKKDIGFITRIYLLILLVLITCTCSTPKLMLGNQIIEKQIDYSLYSGKLVKQIKGATECVTLKIDGQVLVLCPALKQYIKPQLLQMPGLVYYQSLDRMQKKCLPIKSFP